MKIKIETTPIYEKLSRKILSDKEMRDFEEYLSNNPEKGAIIQGGKGLRKIRIAVSGKGKSSGARVIYYYQKSDYEILLLYIYKKNVQSDLTKEQKDALIELVERYY